MKKSHSKTEKVGRILAILLFFYLLILPFIALAVADLTCKGSGSEFCGLWIIVVSPQLLLFIGSSSFLTLSSGTIAGLIIGSVVFVVLVRFVLQRLAHKTLSLSWSFILFVMIAFMVVFGANKFAHPIPADDWTAWSEKAVAKNNPELCLKKVDSSLQNECLSRAARFADNEYFCQALKNSPGFYEGAVDECLVDLAITKNVSAKFCFSDYDPKCMENYCNSVSPEYSCNLFTSYGSISYFVDALAGTIHDPSLCDLYQGSPDSEKRTQRCKEIVGTN